MNYWHNIFGQNEKNSCNGINKSRSYKRFENDNNENSKKVIVGIIGTSGRDNNPNLTYKMYEKMVNKAKSIIMQYKPIKLISGGSSWSDHVAVNLGEEHNIPTTLYLPCNYDSKNQQFDISSYFGRRLNELHKKFTNVVKQDTLKEIEFCNLVPCKTFSERNQLIAENADILLVFGYDKMTSGTKGTCKQFKGEIVYVNINKL